jgi:hypothetical protein
MKQLLLLFFSIAAFSQKTTEPFDSNALGESRELQLPYLLLSKKIPQKISTSYFTGRDYLFNPFYGALSYGAYWDDLPEMIIVGIKNKNNEHIEDSTYDEADNVPQKKELNSLSLLVPNYFLISKKYPIAPFKIIAGHDTTAGFLNFSSIRQPSFGYISLAQS